MRRVSVGLALCGMLIGGVAGAQGSDEALIEAGAQMAYAARVMGACEQHLTQAEADTNLALITAWSDSSSPTERQLSAVFSGQYAKGRADAPRWSPERCTAEMRETASAMRAARAALAGPR